MPRLTCDLPAIVFGVALLSGAAAAQPAMKPSAPDKMMPPTEKARLQACQQKAAQQSIAMDGRAKFVMDCMKAMAK